MLARARWQTARVPHDDLEVLSSEPLNAETKLAEVHGLVTPAGMHYVRTHFPIPRGSSEIDVAGEVAHPLRLVLADIRRAPARTIAVTLECAGNGRRFLEPPVPGEQWGLGAVGTAEWTGAPLRSLLERASPRTSAVEVLFRGADEGTPKDVGRTISYQRALPIDVARGGDVLVAYAMNGEPIPPQHGGPLRLIVAGWYGMASVKWLTRIDVLDRPFVGFYQTDRYVIDKRPLREIAPRAVITSPREDAVVSEGRLEVRGYAWSGAAPVTEVALATARGRHLATLRMPGHEARSWQRFECAVDLADGDDEILARATDAHGNVQPLEQRWNALGYANNASRPVRLRVTRP
jgi:DMSO/TMAO reductase YedYZ molybdopterin-dependent catalytic subunit